tara:strand:+ start:983 stop:1897 length:915 start_codon:yes stop_codon:yes gene_type:complete
LRSIFKHHEYIGDIDYHANITRLYHDDFSMDDRSLSTHKKLILEKNELPFVPLEQKSKDIVSDIYNHVIGYTKKFLVDELKIQTESILENIFEYQYGNDATILGLFFRKAATFYSIHEALQKYKKWNDPIVVLYDEFKDIFHIVHGQQRYFYGKIMGVYPEAFVYSLGKRSAKKMESYIPDLNFNWEERWKEFFFHPKSRGGDYNISHLALFLAQNDSREDIMKEHQQNTYDFASLYTSLGEEVFYYNNDTYLAFMPNKYANKKVKVSVEDEFGIVQHMLWRYCEIHPSEFKMNKKFEVEILID